MDVGDWIFALYMVLGAGFLCTFVLILYGLYLSHKWVRYVDMIMLRRDFHSMSLLFSMRAVMLYGSVFAWDWLAKRQKSGIDDRDWYKVREEVPLAVRRKFIVAYFGLLICCFLMVVPVTIIELLGGLDTYYSIKGKGAG